MWSINDTIYYRVMNSLYVVNYENFLLAPDLSCYQKQSHLFYMYLTNVILQDCSNPSIVLYMLMMSFIFVIVYDLFKRETNM